MPAVDNSMHAYAHFAPRPAAAKTDAQGGANAAAAKDNHFSFSDLLDVINPLQHIPVVGTLYRKLTGDEMGTPAKIAGDTLFGGMMGMVSSVADTAFEAITGKNVGDTVFALFDGSGDAKTDVAAKDPPQAPQLALGSDAPSLVQADAAPTSLMMAAADSEELITAALNRAQLGRAAQAQFAYGRAIGLVQPKAADVVASAY